MSEADFEKLGVFYLGRQYDLAERQMKMPLCLYESRDMSMHALCLGKEGSGKTGLCVGLIEEAAIDSIPVIAIDTTGDVGNILLQFPRLSADDFQPWLNPEKLRRSGMPAPNFAAQQATLWQEELAVFEETNARIQRLKDSADFVIYTPGSSAGLPAALSGTFLTPPNAVLVDGDLFRERISACVSSLLALIGVADNSQRSREFILLANIIKTAWQNKQDLTFAALIRLIQQPNITQVGAFDLDSFYPAKERLELSMSLNNLLASLSFEALITGEALDIDHILHAPNGKPRVCVFSIAHLAEHERMFFVSQLLNELISWMRSQTDTSSLRAMLYIDEFAGYYPSSNNPPSKAPLATLIKHGRSHGLGLLLSSEHPSDLDYKGLSGIGTWFVGQVQSDTDRTNLLNGMEAASANFAVGLDRASLESSIAQLQPRIFVMNNVQEKCPVAFLTRWTLSYLRGPLSSEQIKTLMRKPLFSPESTISTQPSAPDPWWAAAQATQLMQSPRPLQPSPTSPTLAASTAVVLPPVAASTLPPLPPLPSQPSPVIAPHVDPPAATAGNAPRSHPGAPSGIQECFLPVRQAIPSGSQLFYQPMLFAVGNVRYIEPTAALDTKLQYCLLATTLPELRTIDWERSQPAGVWIEDLAPASEAAASFQTVPSVFDDPKSYPFWTESFIAWLCAAKALKLLKSEVTNEYSKPRESERNFRVRLSQSSREQRDQAAETLKLKYLPNLATLNERLLQTKRVFEREEEGQRDHKKQSAVNLGTSVLGGYMGRKAANWVTEHNLDVSGMAYKTGASHPLQRTERDERNIQSATETIEALSEQIDDLNLEFGVAMKELERKFDPLETPLSEMVVSVARNNITVPLIALAWAPFFRNSDGTQTAAWTRSTTAGAKA